METMIKKFCDIRITDVAEVGGKNASLGEMFANLSSQGIAVPDGFASTAAAFRLFLSHNRLQESIRELLHHLDHAEFSNLADTGSRIRELLYKAVLPATLADAIKKAYFELGEGEPVAVAVRSSATAEDLPSASFAGQHESYLNITGEEAVMEAVRKCFSSLYTNRAIKYREENGFAHETVALSVGIQKMVRSDEASSGVMFTLEPESGFNDVVHVSSVWGLGENMVQGTVSPDTWLVFKPTLKDGYNAIIQRKAGNMPSMMIYDKAHSNAVINVPLPADKVRRFSLLDNEVLQLARWAILIEDHYGKPMDIEWAKDGTSNLLYIIQARPETVHHQRNKLQVSQYRLKGKGIQLAAGEAIGSTVSSGVARRLSSPAEAMKLNAGEIIITDITSPDWDPLLRKSGGIVTNKGGRTSHAAIVARESGVPAIVGCGDATEKIRDGEIITVSCCEGSLGFVYEGEVPYEKKLLDFSHIHKPDAPRIMLIGSDPEKAFELSFYPNDGIGLLRIEMIITHQIGIHPMALVKFNGLTDATLKQEIERLTGNCDDKEQFFVDRLADGIATFGAAFYPKDVIVRLSDFKTNEYAHLTGGSQFEPVEENPMLGFRGASRYYHPLYEEGFRLECKALAKVRNEQGLTNIKIMIPFCRTVAEGRKVIALLEEFGLRQKDRGLEIYVMAEIPANVILADEFAGIFDGFSIGSNDLTQLTLGVDRDSALLKDLFDENNGAVKKMITEVIAKVHAAGKKIGLCGQAAGDIPGFAAFLIAAGIDSLSFNPDALLQGITAVNDALQRSTHLLLTEPYTGLQTH